MFLLLLLIFAALVNARKDMAAVIGSGDLIAAATALSSSSTGTSKDESKLSLPNLARGGVLKGFSRDLKGKRTRPGPSDVGTSSAASSSSITTSAIQNTPSKTSSFARKGNYNKREGTSKSVINTDLFLSGFNLQNVALSILSGGGVYIGFRIANVLESLYRRYMKKEDKEINDDGGGKKRAKKSSAGNMDMYNQLKSEQEELWRITHKLYSELEKISAASNSTRVDLAEALGILAEVQTSSSPPPELGTVLGEGAIEDIASMKRELDDNVRKTNDMMETLTSLKEEDIPSMLRAKEQAIVQKVSDYVNELKELVNKKQKSQSGRITDGASPVKQMSPSSKKS